MTTNEAVDFMICERYFVHGDKKAWTNGGHV